MCKACGHRYDRHIFGGMCLECGCQRCVYASASAKADAETKR